MDYDKLIDDLKNLEAIAYGYNINGEVLGMDCSDFEQIMVDAADAITKLVACVGTAEKENAQLKKDLSNWSYNCKAAVERAQHFKRERDEALRALEKSMRIKGILGNDYDLDRLRELVEADREGRCAVLPLVEREYVDKFLDDLKDVFSEWGYEDASVGLFGMNESEKQLAEAIIAALEKEENRNG